MKDSRISSFALMVCDIAHDPTPAVSEGRRGARSRNLPMPITYRDINTAPSRVCREERYMCTIVGVSSDSRVTSAGAPAVVGLTGEENQEKSAYCGDKIQMA